MDNDATLAKPVLIYFEGCPNAEAAKSRLRDAHLDFIEESQDSLPEGHPHLNYTSPTLLLGEQIIFGSKTNADSARGCSLDLPSSDEIRRRLAAHVESVRQ